MKIKLFALMLGIMHGVMEPREVIRIIETSGGMKGFFLSKFYNIEFLRDLPVDENGPLSIIDVLKNYYVTEVNSENHLEVEILYLTILEMKGKKIQHKNGVGLLNIRIFLKRKGTCPSSQFPFPMSGDGEQNANLYLESTFNSLEYLVRYHSTLLPLTSVPGQYDHVNLRSITELCEMVIKKHTSINSERTRNMTYIIDICKLPLIDFIAKYPNAFTKSEIDLIKQCKIINKATSCYELAILLRIADSIECDQSSSTIKCPKHEKINIQRLLDIYFDHIINNKETLIGISDEESNIIKAFCKKYNIDDNVNALTGMKNKILEMIFNDVDIDIATINCKETVNILKLIKEYAFLDESVCGTFNQFLDKRDSLRKEMAEITYYDSDWNLRVELLPDYCSESDEGPSRCFIEKRWQQDNRTTRVTILTTKEGNIFMELLDSTNIFTSECMNRIQTTNTAIKMEIYCCRSNMFTIAYNSNNIWEIESSAGRNIINYDLDIPQPLTPGSITVFALDNEGHACLDINKSTPNPKRQGQAASAQDTASSQQKTSWFRFNISLMLSFVFNKPFMLSFVLFIFIFIFLVLI